MELREMITFLEVARQRSFSRAAKNLGYSQAAVTIQIKQLEAELGVYLFDRIGKQTTMTHQGVIFYEYAAGIVRDLEMARQAVAQTGEADRGTVCRYGGIDLRGYFSGASSDLSQAASEGEYQSDSGYA